MRVHCYYPDCDEALGDIAFPVFEDAHSIQTVIREVIQMVMQRRFNRKDASLVLYALQLASYNLKQMQAERPQPAEVVTDPENVSQTLSETAPQLASEPAEAPAEAVRNYSRDSAPTPITQMRENLPPGTFTIQACYQPEPHAPKRTRSHQQKKQYVI